MHLNWDNGLSVLILILAAISGGRDFAQATLLGHPRRRLQAVLWVAGWAVSTIAAFLPHGASRDLVGVVGLGILCCSLRVLLTLPEGEKPKRPVAQNEHGTL